VRGAAFVFNLRETMSSYIFWSFLSVNFYCFFLGFSFGNISSVLSWFDLSSSMMELPSVASAASDSLIYGLFYSFGSFLRLSLGSLSVLMWLLGSSLRLTNFFSF
jgi:hypothetical protein